MFETTGGDLFRQGMVFAFNDHPDVFIPLTFATLAGGLFLAWRTYRRTGRFGIKLSVVLFMVIALALFGWTKLAT